jgi:hypothetical protein
VLVAALLAAPFSYQGVPRSDGSRGLRFDPVSHSSAQAVSTATPSLTRLRVRSALGGFLSTRLTERGCRQRLTATLALGVRDVHSLSVRRAIDQRNN